MKKAKKRVAGDYIDCMKPEISKSGLHVFGKKISNLVNFSTTVGNNRCENLVTLIEV